MDWTEIIGAILTAASAVIIVIIDNKRNKKLLEYRMDQLEKKVDIHNHYAQRFSTIETDIACIKQELRRSDK